MQHRPSGRRPRPVAVSLALAASLSVLGTACSASVSVVSLHTTTSTTSGSLPGSSLRTGSTVGSQAVAKLVWQTCGSFRCSRLVVPVSYSDAGEGTLSLAVIELPATSDARQAGDLVLNPGGPGASGVQFLQGSVSEFPAALRARFNLVSFDPRGIGGSDPIVCASPAALRRWIALNPDPTTPGAIAAVTAAVKAFDHGCAADLPHDVLADLSTAVVARDMDRLRAALGQAKLDYLGFSYGTYLGALYAQMFPSHVGRLVLDGAVDPALSAAQLDIQQASSFEVDLHDFFAWCPTNASCASELPGGAEATYRSVVNRLSAGGTLTADIAAALGGVQRVDYGIALTGVISSLYATTSWPYLAEGLAEAAAGNGTVLTELALQYAGFNANGTAANLISANIAIGCLDRPSPPARTLPAMARAFAKTAPDFGAVEAWGSLPCDYWPVPATGRPAPIHLSESLPILVVGSTHDPATPYAWAKALTSQLKGAELLTRTGDGHTGYFSSACVRNWVDSYLSTGARPRVGTVCASNT